MEEIEAELATEIAARRKGWTFGNLFPDEGPLRRELYQKHLEFFRAGAQYRERCAMCANRVGKTLGMGGFETALHLTGQYPAWWEGARFTKAIDCWAAGKTNQTTRDIVQLVLLGAVIRRGTRRLVSGNGLIPADLLGIPNFYGTVADLVDTIPVRHASGGWSTLGFKSFQQGRGAFEGTAKHLIWLDEEPPLAIYGECVIRTATTKGRVMMTFTPLEGMTETVQQFLAQDSLPTTG